MYKSSPDYLGIIVNAKNLNPNKNPLAKLSRVLLVEDHRVAEKVTKDRLLALHCQVDVALDGKTALEQIKQQPYDLVVMDIGLPDMSGDEVTRRIRSYELTQSSHLPIVALTAHDDSKTHQACLDVGMNVVLAKPIYLADVAKILNEFIPARKAWLERHEQRISHEQKIIDFDDAKPIFGNKETLLKKALTLLIESLPYETKKLEEAYQYKDWPTIQVIANKLKGGSGYCGALKLKTACAELDNVIRAGLISQAIDSYKQLLTEITALQKFVSVKNLLGD